MYFTNNINIINNNNTFQIDVTWFPYDSQNCTMKFGAWSYTGYYVDLRQLDETGKAVEDKEVGMDLSFFYRYGLVFYILFEYFLFDKNLNFLKIVC